jgi:2,4-dienoyl-CoA reductase-like NADH-dependent reductase (Old Yellow Enzyme family)
MPGVASYLNRDRSGESGQLEERLRFIAQLLHEVATEVDGRRRAAERAQMAETNPQVTSDLEQIIQKLGSIGRIIEGYTREVRKAGIHTAVQVEQLEREIADRYQYSLQPGRPTLPRQRMAALEGGS